MRDFPVFVTEHGVASLTLKEITYRGIAYIRLQDSLEPELLLKECLDFCTAAGAQSVFATGHACLEKFPLSNVIIGMQCCVAMLPTSQLEVIPVTRDTFSQWQEIYNEKMRRVSNATTITHQDREKLAEGGAYFVRENGTLVGIGMVAEDTLHAIASLIPGKGRQILAALCGKIRGDTVRLEVSNDNLPALRLYTAVGFQQTGEISRWYRVK